MISSSDLNGCAKMCSAKMMKIAMMLGLAMLGAYEIAVLRMSEPLFLRLS